MGEHRVLGLMSGTSLDGLDMAYCRLWEAGGQWHYSLDHCQEVPYSPQMRETLREAIGLSEAEHAELHQQYGGHLGQQSKKFLEEHGLKVDFIASHGHTSHHRPDQGITFQLGAGQRLADTAGQKVVCDFRSKDVSLGGQGAPLVPIGDRLLFPQYDFCLNLGGISNISFESQGNRIAFDIGLANMPLNHIVQGLGLEYDKDGALARSGQLDPQLLEALDALAYYRQPPPKSTGLEWFKAEVLPLMEASKRPEGDLLYTLVVHNARQIARVVHRVGKGLKSRLLATGGGALNGFFMDTLREELGSRVEVVVPDPTLIAYKEALVFALMGALRIEGRTNVLKSVTGASEDSCSGEIYLPSRN